jgi:hypothetical protein
MNIKANVICKIANNIFGKYEGVSKSFRTELAAWSENCKWYSSLPLGALVS